MRQVRIFMLIAVLCIVSSNTHAQLRFFDCAASSLSGPVITGQLLDGERHMLLQGGYESPTWSGSLKKYAFGETGLALPGAVSALWEAADQWPPGSGNPAASRKIYTLDVRTGRTVSFHWENLSEDQQQGLHRTTVDGRSDERGPQRVAYLRGQRDGESGSDAFRPRKSIFGAILNSTPAVSPTSGAAGRNAVRDSSGEAVFVEANDGMLHGFSLADGRELFAYVPAFLLPSLGLSTSAAASPRPWFDGKLVVRDVALNGASKTILAGAAGMGAKGLVALDVSAPDQFSRGAGVLWEFSDADDPDMGHVTTPPAIARFQVRPGQPARQFVVVTTGQASSGTVEPGRLFLLALDKPVGASWVANQNYFKLATSGGSASASAGLGAPALVPDDDGVVRHAYAGDLAGDLWRFDFNGAAPWPSAHLVFTATAKNGARQPVVVKPHVVFAPGRGYLVLFGTGRLLDRSDGLPSGFAAQSFYTVHDTVASTSPRLKRSDLVERTLKNTGANRATIEGKLFDYGTASASRKGWYLDFPDAPRTGERLVENPLVDAGQLVFHTVIPAADGCDRGGGRTWMLSALDGLPPAGASVLSGTPVQSRAASGIAGGPLLWSESALSVSNAVSGASLSRKLSILVPGRDLPPGASGEPLALTTALPVRRLGWREVVNWPELRQSASQH